MNAERKVEVFSAGCPACGQAVELVRKIACPSCEVAVLDMRDPAVARQAEKYGVRSLPAVVVDGKLAACCVAGGIDEPSLRQEGVGVLRP